MPTGRTQSHIHKIQKGLEREDSIFVYLYIAVKVAKQHTETTIPQG